MPKFQTLYDDTTLTAFAVLLVAITMGLALVHALEFPGKLRLNEPTYRSVQTIYYPGFTIGGLVGEFGALLVLPVLLYLRFRTVLVGGCGVCPSVVGHLTYWFVTHPVNNVWLKDVDVSGLGATFLSAFAGQDADWRRLRDVWEYSHVARAGFAMASLTALVIGATQ